MHSRQATGKVPIRLDERLQPAHCLPAQLNSHPGWLFTLNSNPCLFPSQHGPWSPSRAVPSKSLRGGVSS